MSNSWILVHRVFGDMEKIFFYGICWLVIVIVMYIFSKIHLRSFFED